MTSDSPGLSPTRDDADLAPAYALLELSRAMARPLDEAAVIEAFASSGGATDSTDVEQLDRVASIGHELGLRVSLASATVGEARAVLDGGQPLLTTRATDGRWFVVAPAKGRRYDVFVQASDGAGRDVGERQTVRGTEIAALLGRDENADVTWLVAHAGTPNADAASAQASGETLTPVARLMRLLAPERSDVLAVIAFAVAIGVLMLGTPIAVQSIVNSVALGGTLQPLIVIAFFLGVALTFLATLTLIQIWVVELLQRRIFVRSVADLADRLPRVTREAYDVGFGPERVNRFFDVLTIQKSSAKLLIDAMGLVLSVVVGLTVLAFYHPLLLAFALVLVVIIALVVLGPRKRGERYALAESSAKFDVAGWLEEIAASPEAFRSAGAQQWVHERADALTRTWVEARSSHFKTLLTHYTGAIALQVVVSVGLLAIGGVLVIQGSLTLGQLVAAELIVSSVVVSFAKVGRYLETWYDLLAAVSKVGYLLDLPIEDLQGEHPETTGQGRGARVEVKDLVWTSQVSGARLAIEALDVAAGEHVAVGGLDGTSRLALADLLWRLRLPESGVVRLDRRDVRELAADFLRDEVAIVSSIEVIHGTIRDNVRLRRPAVSNDEVREALEVVGLTDRIARLPQGMDSPMHPAARLLSDDDRRTLMLARALAGRPRVLVVDSGGLGSGASFCSAIERVLDSRNDMTILVLTNDVSPWSRCDRVVNLKGSSQAETAKVVA